MLSVIGTLIIAFRFCIESSDLLLTPYSTEKPASILSGLGLLVMYLIVPPTALDPYKVPWGPLSTSILSKSNRFIELPPISSTKVLVVPEEVCAVEVFNPLIV